MGVKKGESVRNYMKQDIEWERESLMSQNVTTRFLADRHAIRNSRCNIKKTAFFPHSRFAYTFRQILTINCDCFPVQHIWLVCMMDIVFIAQQELNFKYNLN